MATTPDKTSKDSDPAGTEIWVTPNGKASQWGTHRMYTRRRQLEWPPWALRPAVEVRSSYNLYLCFFLSSFLPFSLPQHLVWRILVVVNILVSGCNITILRSHRDNMELTGICAFSYLGNMHFSPRRTSRVEADRKQKGGMCQMSFISPSISTFHPSLPSFLFHETYMNSIKRFPCSWLLVGSK